MSKVDSDWPAVTAIVNTCPGRAALLDRALASVDAQTYKDFEVIVVHDGPMSPETGAVLDNWQLEFLVPFVAFGLEEQSGYQCVPKNHATYSARGDYIAYLDDDNEWTPDHLELLVAAIEDDTPDENNVLWPDLVYGRREYVIDPGWTPTRELVEGPSPYVPWNARAVESLKTPTTNFIDTSDFLVAKGALWRMQLATDMIWDERLRRFADWNLLCRGVFFTGWKPRGIDAIVQRYHWTGKNVQLTSKATPRSRKIDELQSNA